jgi:hypothetical protein
MNWLMSGHVEIAAIANQKAVLLGMSALGSLQAILGQTTRLATTKATNNTADHKLTF